MENKKSLVPVASIVKTQGFFRSFDGLKLFYSSEGPKDAPPLLFCYGLVCSKLQWKYQMEHFSKTHRVIYFDYRGHNQSESPDDPTSMTIEAFAKDMAALHDELHLPPVPILGHSLGVNIILEFYRRYPEKVSAMILANGTPKDPFETMFGHNFMQVLFPLLPLFQKLAPDMLAKLWASQGTSRIGQEIVALLGFNTKYARRKDINEYLRLTSQVRSELVLHLLEDFVNYDACVWLDQVRAPSLFIGGSKDYVTPPQNTRKMAKLVSGSKLKIVPEGSHCVQMEQVDLVNELIEGFLREVSRKETKARIVKERRKSKVHA